MRKALRVLLFLSFVIFGLTVNYDRGPSQLTFSSPAFGNSSTVAPNYQCGVDQDGDGIWDGMEVCTSTPQGQYCPIQSAECNATYAAPSCPDPIKGPLNTLTDLCEAVPVIHCLSPYDTYNPDLRMCLKNVECSYNGIFDTPNPDQCTIDPTTLCPSGYSYDSNLRLCVKSLECSAGGLFVSLPTSNLNDSLRGYWKLDVDPNDSSGNGNNGVVSGATFTGGKFGQAASFNGTSNYIQINNSPSLNPPYITVAAWAKSNTANWNSSGSLVSKRDAYILFPNAGSKQVLFYINSGGWRSVTFDGSGIDITQWHHYVGTFDGVTISIYVDGILKSTASYTGSINTADTGPLYLGWDDGQAGRYLNGLLDEVAIWSRALSTTEITKLYSNNWIASNSNSRCEIPPTYSCPSGYAFITGTTKCEATLSCDKGVYNSSTKTCLSEPEWRCPTNYTWDATLQMCTAPESACPNPSLPIVFCPDKYVYDPSFGWCDCLYRSTTGDCPLGNTTDPSFPPAQTRDEANRYCFWDDTRLFVCERDPMDITKPVGNYEYKWDDPAQKCVIKPVKCGPGASEWVEGAYRCKIDSTVTYGCPEGTTPSGAECLSNPKCPTGETFDSTLGQCVSSIPFPPCPDGFEQTSSTETSIECLKPSPATCPGTSAINYITDLCTESPGLSCPASYAYDGDKKCLANPSCLEGTVFISSNGMCSLPMTSLCPPGFTYNTTLARCVSPPPCPSGIAVTAAPDINGDCPAGFAYDPITLQCNVTVDSVYNGTTDTCTIDYTKACPYSYRYNPGTNRCERSIDCPDGTVYSSIYDKCVMEGKCADGSTPVNGQCNSTPVCPTDYVYQNQRCEKAPPFCNSSTYDPATDKCVRDMLPYCPQGYSYLGGICQSAPICPAGGVYSDAANRCEADGNLKYFCDLNLSFYDDLLMCNNSCKQTASCSVDALNFFGTATTPGGQTGDYQITPSGKYIKVKTPSGTETSVHIGPCRFTTGTPLSFTYQGNSFYTTMTATGTGIRVTGLTFSGSQVLLTWDMTWEVYGCNLSGSLSVYGTLDQTIGFVASNGALYPQGVYGSGSYTTSGNISFSPVEACPIANAPCVSGQCTVEKACRPVIECPNTDYQATPDLKCVADEAIWPKCPGNGVFHPETDSCQEATLYMCPTPFVESGGKCTTDPYCTGASSILDLSLDMCIACPNGFTYRPSTKTCEELPACPTGTVYDTVTKLCTSDPVCPLGGIRFGSLCVNSWTPVCPAQWTYNTTAQLCSQATVCPDRSTLNITADLCTIALGCPAGFTANNDTGNCEVAPNCPSGGGHDSDLTTPAIDPAFFDVSLMKCMVYATYPCSDGNLGRNPLDPYTLPATCTGPPSCSTGSYNGSTDRCEEFKTVYCPSDHPVKVGNNCYKYSSPCGYGNYDPSRGVCTGLPLDVHYSCPGGYDSNDSSLETNGTTTAQTFVPWMLHSSNNYCYRSHACPEGSTGKLFWRGVKYPSNLEKGEWAKMHNWGGTGCCGSGPTVTADTDLAPDGTKSADKITFIEGDNYVHQIILPNTVLAGRTFKLSVWAKDVSSLGSAYIQIHKIAYSDYCSYGSTCYNQVASVRTDSLGWKKYELTYTFPSSETWNGNNLAVVIKAGVAGASVLIWDAQMEESTATATSNYCISQLGLQCTVGSPANVFSGGSWKNRCYQGGGDSACPDADGYPKSAAKGLVNGLIGYWHLDGNLDDSSGNNRNGTAPNGGPTWTTGKFGQTGSFVNGQYISIPSSSYVNMNGPRTLAAWVYGPVSGNRTLFYDGGGYAKHIAVSGGTLGVFVFPNFYSAGFNMTTLSAGWHHIAAVGQSGYTDFYVDGNIVGRASAQATYDINYINYAWEQVLMDEVAIWNRALLTYEIQKLYNNDWTAPGFCRTETIFSCPSGSTGAYYGPPVNKYQCSMPPVCPQGGTFNSSTNNCSATATDPKCPEGYILDSSFSPPKCVMNISQVCGQGGTDMGGPLPNSTAAIIGANAADGNPNTYVTLYKTSTNPIQYDFGANKKTIKAYQLQMSQYACHPNSWVLEASNDGTTWTTVDTRNGVSGWSNGGTKSFVTANDTSYKIYRFRLTVGGCATYSSYDTAYIAEVTFYTAYLDPTRLGTPFCGVNVNCPPGYDLNSQGACVSPPICSDNGLYSSTDKKCHKTPVFECPTTEYSYNEATEKCEAEPVCPTYCPDCPDGKSFYNSDKNMCYMGNTSCPLNTATDTYTCMNVNNVYRCSPNQCIDMNGAEEIFDEPDLSSYTNDGTVNQQGQCSGTFLIFSGKGRSCRKPSIDTSFFNCCDSDLSTALFGTIGESCNSGEIETVVSREAGKCVEVDSNYCSRRLQFAGITIGCRQRKKIYCCFNSKLARIIHDGSRAQGSEGEHYPRNVGGRVQLKDFNSISTPYFGTGRHPECKGFTPDEFANIDFSKINMSEYADEVSKTAQETMGQTTDKLKSQTTDQINQFYNNILQ